ncbi:MAG: EAL domain-containing protein [Nocardioidaceae bacterium]
MDVPVNLVNSGLVGVVVWPLFPAWVIVLWLVSFGVVSLNRALLRHRYANAMGEARASPSWARMFTVNAFVAGCLWGLSASVILVTPDPAYYNFIVFVLGGTTTGGIVCISINLRAMLAFILPTIVPAILALALRGGLVQIEMATMLALFTCALVWAGRSINHSVTQNVRLRFDQERLVAHLRASEAASASLAAIVDASDDAIVSETVGGDIVSWNRGAERMFGYRADEAIGRSVRMIIPDERRSEIDRNLDTLAHGRRIDPFDTERLRKDGARVPVSIAVSLTYDSLGTAFGASFIARNISERQEAAQALDYRDRLLHAVTLGTKALVEASSLDVGMPEALRVIGESMRADRLLVIRLPPEQVASMAVRYRWESTDIQMPIAGATFRLDLLAPDVAATWLGLLTDGKPVIAQLATSEGSVRELFTRFGNKSTLIVPIFIGDACWGGCVVDACTEAREWHDSEINTLSTFGDIAGAVIHNTETQCSLEKSEARLRAVTWAAQDAIITVDGSARIGLWNRAAERITGYTAEEAVGRQVHHLLAPARSRAKADAGMNVFLETGQGDEVGRTTELLALRKDGTEIAVELSLAAARLDDGWGAIGVLRDVTTRKNAEAKLQFANLLLRTQMEASLDGILVVDENKSIVAYNERFATMWHIPPADLAAGRDEAVLERVAAHMVDRKRFVARVDYLYAHPEMDPQDQFVTSDGRSIDRYSVTLYGRSRAYLGRAWFFRDITERKRTEELALRMARFDVVTGLANRAVFVEALRHAIATTKRGDKSFALIYLDLDHFKDVNDNLGHPVGDELLRAVADRLRANTRESDTVARFGGDEFAIILTNVSDPSDAAILAEKLLIALAVPYSLQGSDIHSGASIGIAVYAADAAHAETLLSHADVALYRAKAEGRGGYRFFTDLMDTEVRSRVTLGAELRVAVGQGQLFLMYQPQVAVDTGQIMGLEALVRWQHPQRGVLGPDLFIPLAEQVGIIGKLGHWVLWEACRQARAWLDDGLPLGRMAVNVSALQFRSPVALEADVAAALARSGLAPQMLELELTESVLMDASRDHSDVLQRLRDTGVTVAIDDFGTGFSSLSYLRRFPSDRIKIAQTFVKNLVDMPGDAAIIRATIGLAHELRIDIIAEGVETPEQYELLKGWGIGQVQGFLFSEPLTAQDAAAVLRDGKIVYAGAGAAR